MEARNRVRLRPGCLALVKLAGVIASASHVFKDDTFDTLNDGGVP
jgi:hypothetical protein